MPDQLDRIGVEAVWAGKRFTEGYNQYLRELDRANKRGEAWARQMMLSGDAGVKAYEKFQRAAQRSLKEAERAQKSYVKSAIDLQAIFQQTSQLATQFGGALREAAAGKAIRQSFQNLAKASGVSADALITNMKRASKGTVAEVELIRIANRALLAGGATFAKELPRLFEIARAASIATGQDIGFVFDTLTRGIAKASPLLIDNAEIYIKVGQAVDAYAESIGKSKDDLTAQQRQVATLNAVLEQGADFVKSVGSETAVATDEFDRWNAQVKDAKEATASLIDDALGPLGPILKEAGGLFQTLNPLLYTYVVLSRQAAAGGLVAGLVGAIGPLSAVAAGLGAGVLVYEKGIRAINRDLPPATQTISQFADLTQWAARSLIQGKDAANEWMRAAQGIPTLAERTAEAQQKHLDVIAEARTYDVYLEQIAQINDELGEGEIAITLYTESQYKFARALGEGNITINQRIKLLQELAQTESGLVGIAANVGIAALNVAQAVKEAAAETRQAQEDVTASIEEAQLGADLAAQLRDAKIAEYKVQSRMNQEIEKEENRHQARMADITRKGVADRADAARDLRKAIESAERDRHKALEDAARSHAQRVQDVETEHKRRLRDIERDYTKTVREAAIERDALAILQARERRQEEIQDADEQRRDALADESRNYQEQIRQAQEAYREQVQEARQAYRERLAEIDRALAEERRKQQAAWQQQLADLRARHRQERAEDRAHYGQLEVDLQAHLIRMRGIQSRYGQARGRGGAPAAPGRGGVTPMQAGFDGLVTGPHTFKVEPGVVEYVHASGDLRQPQTVLPSPVASQAQSMRAMVSGAVGVGLHGFPAQLMERIGPQLRDMTADAVLDIITDEIEQLSQG